MEEFAESFFEEIKPLIKEIREQENEETSKKDDVAQNTINLDEIKPEDVEKAVTKQELKKQLQEKAEKFIADYEEMLQKEIEDIKDRLDVIREKKEQAKRELKKAKNKLKRLKKSDEKKEDREKVDILNEHIELLTKDLQNIEESENALLLMLNEYEKEQDDFHEIMGNIDFENDEYLSIFEKIIDRNEKEVADKNKDNQEAIENNNAFASENPNIQESVAGNELEEFFKEIEKNHPISEELKIICRVNPEFANLMFQEGDNFYKEAVLAVLYEKFSENYNKLSEEIDEIITIQKRKENITRLKPGDYEEEKPRKIITMDDIRKKEEQGKAKPKAGENPTAKPQGKAEPKEGEKQTAKPQVKAKPKAGEKPTAKPQVKAEPKEGEKQTAKPQVKAEPKAGEKPAAKPEVKAEPKIDIADQNMRIVIKPDQDEILIYMKDKEKPLHVTDILERFKEGKQLSIGKYFREKNVDKADPSILAILNKLEEKQVCKGVVDEYLRSFESQETKQIDSIQYLFDRKSDKAKKYKKIEKYCKKYAKAGIETGIVDVEKVEKEKGKFAKFVDKFLYKLSITKTPNYMKEIQYLNEAEEKEALPKQTPKGYSSKAEERQQWISRMNKAIIENPTRTFQGTRNKPKEKSDNAKKEESVR